MQKLTLFVLVAAVGAACSVYDSSLLLDGGADAASDGAVEAGSDGGADADTCNHAEPPTRPAADNPSDAGDQEIVLALTSMDFDVNGDAGAYGYDLDRTCTCPGPESCVPASGAQQHCDDSRGRDNSGGALIQKFAALGDTFDATAVSQKLQNGFYSVLIRIRGYNGTANDGQVAVATFTSDGTAPLDDGGANPKPRNDGTDTWSVDPASLIGTPPPYVAANEDNAAYVANGQLVSLITFPLSISSSLSQNFLRLDGAYLVGALSHASGLWKFSGVIAGRWAARNLLTGLQALEDPFNAGQYLCGNDATYMALKSAICGATDIAQLAASDNTGAPCDALSLAVGITAEQALLGPLTAGTPAPTPCGSTYVDQCGN